MMGATQLIVCLSVRLLVEHCRLEQMCNGKNIYLGKNSQTFKQKGKLVQEEKEQTTSHASHSWEQYSSTMLRHHQGPCCRRQERGHGDEQQHQQSPQC